MFRNTIERSESHHHIQGIWHCYTALDIPDLRVYSRKIIDLKTGNRNVIFFTFHFFVIFDHFIAPCVDRKNLRRFFMFYTPRTTVTFNAVFALTFQYFFVTEVFFVKRNLDFQIKVSALVYWKRVRGRRVESMHRKLD